MAIQVGTAGTRIIANAAAVATAMGGGTTAAEVQALGAFLVAAGLRPATNHQLLVLLNNKELTENR